MQLSSAYTPISIMCLCCSVYRHMYTQSLLMVTKKKKSVRAVVVFLSVTFRIPKDSRKRSRNVSYLTLLEILMNIVLVVTESNANIMTSDKLFLCPDTSFSLEIMVSLSGDLFFMAFNSFHYFRYRANTWTLSYLTLVVSPGMYPKAQYFVFQPWMCLICIHAMQLFNTKPVQSARHLSPNGVVPTAARTELCFTHPIHTDTAEKQERNVR